MALTFSIVKEKFQKYQIYFWLVVSAALWGSAWPIARILATAAPPLTIITIRYGIGVALFFLITLIKERKLEVPWKRKRDLIYCILMGILSITIYQIFFIFGVKNTFASDATVVVAFSPSITAILSLFFIPNEKCSGRLALGVLVAFGGAVTVALGSSSTKEVTFESRMLGDGLVAGGSLVYAVYSILLRLYFLGATKPVEPAAPQPLDSLKDKDTQLEELENENGELNKQTSRVGLLNGNEEKDEDDEFVENGKSMETQIDLEDVGNNSLNSDGLKSEKASIETVHTPEHSHKSHMSNLPLMSWISFCGWLPLVPLALILEDPFSYSWSLEQFGLMTYLAIFPLCTSYYIYTVGVSMIGATQTSVFTNFVPVFGVLASFILLGEEIGWSHPVGLLFIWVGVILVNFRQFFPLKPKPENVVITELSTTTTTK